MMYMTREDVPRIQVYFEVVIPGTILPERATSNRAFYDIYSAESVDILPGDVVRVRTGLKMQCPSGYFIEIRPRSSIATKYKVVIPNSPAVIDSDYGEEVLVPMLNLSKAIYHIDKHNRIAQMNVVRYNDIEWSYKKISGTSGFGSTGV